MCSNSERQSPSEESRAPDEAVNLSAIRAQWRKGALEIAGVSCVSVRHESVMRGTAHAPASVTKSQCDDTAATTQCAAAHTRESASPDVRTYRVRYMVNPRSRRRMDASRQRQLNTSSFSMTP